MKRVLVIDDSATIRNQVGTLLREAGYQVEEAADGVEALEVIRASNGWSLVICDVNMPRMNGLDMVEALKKDETFARLPVLMLTSEGQPSLIERARKAGASGWVVKPFQSRLLVAAVAKLTGA